MGAHCAEADAKDARDVTVRAAAGNQGGNLTFARRQCASSPATQQRAPQMRLKRIEQIEIARTKFRTALRPPNTKIAEVAVAVEDEHIDAVVQTVARRKVIVELGAHQLAAGNDLVDQGRAPARPQLKRHRIAKLVPFFVAAKIARRHVEADGFVEQILARIPDVGSAEIAPQ